MKEAMHWMLLAGSVLDTLLIVRMFGLRLHRIYAFVTLDCVLSGFLDWVSMYLGWDSPETLRVYVFTRFLYALLTPLIAWDVFEEVKLEAAKIRKVEATRMAASLVIIAFLSIVVGVGLLNGDSNEASQWTVAVAWVLWGGACAIGMVFIWRTGNALLKQGTALPRNTTVWSFYYLLTWGSSVLSIVLALFNLKINADLLDMVSNGWLMACTIFCMIRLKGASVAVATERVD